MAYDNESMQFKYLSMIKKMVSIKVVGSENIIQGRIIRVFKEHLALDSGLIVSIQHITCINVLDEV